MDLMTYLLAIQHEGGGGGGTDEKVVQTTTSANEDFRILLSNSASDITETTGVNKHGGLLYNPDKKALTIGDRLTGSTVGNYSVAQGKNVVADSVYSYAEGFETRSTNVATHAEGASTTASGSIAHAEGQSTIASMNYSHAEGYYTTASGQASHAEGSNTIAKSLSQHVFGEYNIPDTKTGPASKGNYVEIVGNGTSNVRSNARTLDWNGNEVLAGKLTIGAAPTSNMDVATKQYVDNLVDTAITQVLAAAY